MNKWAHGLFILSFLSLGLKMILQLGPIFPGLGTAVYGGRPLIIGYLHLIFLGFLTLYVLSSFLESGFFERNWKTRATPVLLFTFGVILNEVLLMLQGLGILFFTNSNVYSWLLWINSFVLFLGGILITSILRYHIGKEEKKSKLQFI